jgi:proteasome-associated ATPase
MPDPSDAFFRQSISFPPTAASVVTRAKYDALEERLQAAIEKLKEQDEFIKQVSAQPAIPGIVVATHEAMREGMAPSVDVISNGSLVRLPVMDRALWNDLSEGSYVLVIVGSGIVAEIDPLPSMGKVVHVKQSLGPTKVEVSLGGESAVIWNINEIPLKEGDRVVIDQTNTCILDVLPPPPAPTAKAQIERVTWEDIIVHEDVRDAIEQAVVWPKKHALILKAYGQREAKGVLFWGPPGCGKTLVAKVTATLLADDHEGGFFSVRGPELMNPFVGETERLIRELFAAARKHQRDTGDRAVVFIDEADSCLGRRGRHLHSDISVPAFLTEMDGLDARDQPLVILATNRPHDLDEAIVREGRVDSRIEIKRPELADVRSLFALYMNKRPHEGGAIHLAAELLSRSPLWNDRSGALVAALVDKMTARAITRDLASGVAVPSGITANDVQEAIVAHALNHQL